MKEFRAKTISILIIGLIFTFALLTGCSTNTSNTVSSGEFYGNSTPQTSAETENPGVSDDIIKEGAGYVAESTVGVLAENMQLSNITHNIDETSQTDLVTYNLVAKGYTCKLTMKVSKEYLLNNPGRVRKTDIEVISREWLFDDLVGTSWSGSVGIGATRIITFNSIDQNNKTINLSYYGFQDDCPYEFTDYNDSEAIKVYLPNESFTDQMWIFENGEIRYGALGGLGGVLSKKTDN